MARPPASENSQTMLRKKRAPARAVRAAGPRRYLAVIQLLRFPLWLASKVDPEAAERILVHRGEQNAGMRFQPGEAGKLGNGTGGKFVVHGADGEGDEHLVRMQARVAVAQRRDLQALNGLDDALGNQLYIVRDTGQRFQDI